MKIAHSHQALPHCAGPINKGLINYNGGAITNDFGRVLLWTMPGHGKPDEGWLTDRLQVGGTSVYCRRITHEDGVPLVHIHGFAISGAYLMPTARALATRGVSVVPNLPGYGRSERRDRVLGIPAMAATTLTILDRLDIDKAVLVGNSMACAISLEVAHEALERIHSLVLVSPAGGVHNQPISRALGQLARDVFRENTKMFPVALPDYVRFGPLNGLRLFRELTRFPSLERLLRNPLPTLAVLGVRDPLMPSPDRIREVARRSPEHLTVATVDGAAHAVNFSHPTELAGVIGAWLDNAVGDGTPLPDGVRLVATK